MGLIYIKTWDELKADCNVNSDSYYDSVLSYPDKSGNYNKVVHAKYGGQHLKAEVYEDGWAKYDDIWFARWTYLLPGEKSIMHPDDFTTDYDAFLAWENSLERRMEEAHRKLKQSFRKAYPKDYRNEP